MALLLTAAATVADTLIPVGVARIDISPRAPVPLMGYAARAKLGATAEIAQPIHARALAFGSDQDLAILLTIDNCILPGKITEELRRRLKEKRQVAVERVVLTVTHTHSAPCLSGAAPNIFAADFSAEDQKAIDAYTAFFVDQLERVAEQAVADRKPAKVAWGKGRAGFAKNRRTAGGPVEHEMPMLRVLGEDNSLRAVFVSYACHCTTLGGEFNAVHGDWAGVASSAIERAHPGAIGLVAIGCGADANPEPRGSVELATRHGEEIGREVDRLLSTTLSPLNGVPLCQLESLQLPFQPHFSRAQWEERAAGSGIVGYHARKWLARMDRGEQPPQAIPYPVQTWTFGKDLAMIFLGGEVVVDYALRLARELDPKRIWTVAYSNDVPCYIPSKRILAEGGYEAESSLWYYDRPQRLAPEGEDLIVGAAHKLLGNDFARNSLRSEMPPPRSVEAAKAAFQLRKEFTIQAAAFEPLVQSPVAIDFAADGRLWVCEMRDYPQGMDGKGKPGGCVKLLRDENGDGIYDTAEVWAEDLPFPTGIMEWRDGVLVCAAPDIWHLSRAAGSHDPAIKRVRLLSGFATDNFQARVSGLRLGLDGWVHGSGGLFGGRIVSHKTGKTHDCSNRDFRFRPDSGEFEALAGVSQQGHVRDDFDQWFGNDNSNLLWHFPLPDRYRKRNPHFVAAPMRVAKSRDADSSRVFPVSVTLERFNDPHAANRLTSASGPEIFREQSFGQAFAGNAFVCEPVHNLVRRAILTSEAGATFATRRADDEQTSEFLASSDNWFRPVEARTGPDGALWIVDMYRFVIEHPRWIPEERLKQLDVRAGAERGRIWRVMPATVKWERPPDVRRRSSAELASEIGVANGVRRDQAHRILLERPLDDSRSEAAPVLARIAAEGIGSENRAHALALLSGLEALDEATLLAALKDADARVRRYAVSVCEPYLRDTSSRRDELLPRRLVESGSEGRARVPNRPNGERVLQALRPLIADPDAGVRYQLALSLGESRTPLAAELLSASALHDCANEWHRAAVLSSALAAPDKLAHEILAADVEDEPFTTLRSSLITTFVASGATGAVAEWIAKRFPIDAPGLSPAKLPEAFRLLAALTKNPALRAKLTTDPGSITARALGRLESELDVAAPQSFTDTSAPEGTRTAALEFLAERARHSPQQRGELLQAVDVELPTNLRQAWLEAVRRQTAPEVAPTLLASWPRRSPAERSELTALLLSRDAWMDALLDATRKGEISAAEFSPLQQQQLREHTNHAVRERATKLFPKAESQRAGVVAQFSAVHALRSNSERGQAVFDRACATCHRFGDRGHSVGPELELSRAKPLSDLLLAIFDPNAAIEPRYAAWHAQLKDGRSATGVVRDESSASLRMVQPGGTSELIRRSDIAQMQPLPNSLMPEGLEQLLTAQDVADLIGWLKASVH